MEEDLGKKFEREVTEEDRKESLRKNALLIINEFLNKGGKDKDLEFLKKQIENYDNLDKKQRIVFDSTLEDSSYIQSRITSFKE